jgi:DNA-binding response OmpR family regulator
VHLTPTEFELLRTLMRNRGRLMTHRALLTEVWGAGYEHDTQVLRVHLANLRRKIEPTPSSRHIVTDPGVGDRFAEGTGHRPMGVSFNNKYRSPGVPCLLHPSWFFIPGGG